jgi:hypothetical protein
VAPRFVPLTFAFENESHSHQVLVQPPQALKRGRYFLEGKAKAAQVTFSSGYRVIAYPHIQSRHSHLPATAAIEVVDVQIPPDLKVGYVMGVGDEVGKATEQLGAHVTYLSKEDLSTGRLSQYDTIITGVRAYLNRDDLRSNNQRLLEYVRRGGHLVVQYNKYEFLESQFSPYPVNIHRPHDRVTVEESPVKVLVPGHPLLNLPNRINESDWSGWVQERGLYFLGDWDERYTPLLELRDPWPYNPAPKRGALVVARYGKGTYIYTGLAFFRQLPAGVEGAFQLWANLISYRRYAGEG